MEPSLMRETLAADDRHWWYRGRRRVIRAELDSLDLPVGASILDAGCGSGRMMAELARYGTVSGIERDDDVAEIARARDVGEVRSGCLEALPWPDGCFDLLTCLDVIEHTTDDRAALAELRRACRPGGRLLLTVPAYPALWSSHDVANHHHRRYTRASLRAASQAAGWELERLSSFNTVLLAPAAAVRLAERRRAAAPRARSDLNLGPPWLNRMLEWPLALEAHWLSRGRTLPAGLSLLAVLRRAETR
jgi:SAM-dependent methyltransferase